MDVGKERATISKPSSYECAHGILTKHFRSHHHYKIDNEEFAMLQRRSTPLSGLSSIRRASTPTNGIITGSHHHHHHRHNHHNHTPHTPSFKSNTMIKISPVLEAASKTPRRHLGSFLYNPKISATDSHTPVRTKLNVSIQPNLLPSWRDPGQVNCTYTVRVSKTWLRRDEREAICAERYLWGSGIFTDDSDPVAAAIHSGYLKGAWGEWVDTTLLEQIIQEQNPKIDAGQENVPKELVEPPPGMDLHITLLVLPQLEQYEGTVRYGLKSRSWPEESYAAPHDGASFMVLNCEWVNGKSERGKGRTGEERRQRLRREFANRLGRGPTVKPKASIEMAGKNILVKAAAGA
jgi:Histone deacetylation protein Rxt3